MRYQSLLTCSALASIACPAFPAISADATAKLEEIIVTAQRREQGVTDVPIAITALSGDYLESRQIFDTESLSQYTPSLHIFAEQTGSEFYTIRGVGRSNEDLASDSGVAVFIDDVYIARQGAANLSIFDVERVEVLRGPQGTLWGKNATGGAINVVTRKPSEQPEANIGFDLAKYGTLNVRGGVSSPLIEDKLFGRLAFSNRKRDGLYKNLTTGEKGNNIDTQAFRASLKYLVSDQTMVNFSADWAKVDQDGVLKSIIADVPGTPYILKDFYTVTFATEESDVRSSRAGTHGKQGVEQYGFNLTVNHQLENMEFISVSGYRSEESFSEEDNDRAPERSGEVSSDQKSQTFSQEFRLVSTGEGPWSWTIGLYYFRDDGDRAQFRYSDFFGPGGLQGPGSPEVQDSTTTFLQHLETDAWAAFGEVTYDLTERLTLTLGGRYSYEKKDYNITAFAVANPGSTSDYSLFIPEGAYSAIDDHSWSDFTPKVVLSYALTPATKTYLSFTQGFKSGGYNGSPDTAADVIPFEPEEVAQYEWGIKGRFFDDRLSTNLAAFFIDFDDLQLQGFDPVTGSPITNNAASAEIKGAEIEISAQIGQGLRVNLGASYLDHEFKEYAIEVFDPTIVGGPPFRLVNKAGERLGLIPDYNAHLGAEYTWPFASGAKMAIGGDFVAVDKTITVFDTLWSDSYEVFNAHATYTPAAENWDITLWVKNLTDEDYYRGGGPVPDLNDQISRLGLYADPRIVGLTFNMRFGD